MPSSALSPSQTPGAGQYQEAHLPEMPMTTCELVPPRQSFPSIPSPLSGVSSQGDRYALRRQQARERMQLQEEDIRWSKQQRKRSRQRMELATTPIHIASPFSALPFAPPRTCDTPCFKPTVGFVSGEAPGEVTGRNFCDWSDPLLKTPQQQPKQQQQKKEHREELSRQPEKVCIHSLFIPSFDVQPRTLWRRRNTSVSPPKLESLTLLEDKEETIPLPSLRHIASTALRRPLSFQSHFTANTINFTRNDNHNQSDKPTILAQAPVVSSGLTPPKLGSNEMSVDSSDKKNNRAMTTELEQLPISTLQQERLRVHHYHATQPPPLLPTLNIWATNTHTLTTSTNDRQHRNPRPSVFDECNTPAAA